MCLHVVVGQLTEGLPGQVSHFLEPNDEKSVLVGVVESGDAAESCEQVVKEEAAQCVDIDKEERVTVFPLLEGCMDERVMLSDPVLVERVVKGASNSSIGLKLSA